MAIDTARVGAVAMEMMDSIAEHHERENATIGTMALIVEVKIRHEDGTESTVIGYQCTDDRVWVHMGLFTAAQMAANKRD